MVLTVAIHYLHIVKGFQVLLSSINSFICILLNSFKCIKWLSSSNWPIDGSLTGSTTSVQSGPVNNGNEWELHTPLSCTTRASL